MMNRRGFIKAAVATLALTTGLARTTLALAGEKIQVNYQTFVGQSFGPGELDNYIFNNSRFVDCTFDRCEAWFGSYNRVDGGRIIGDGTRAGVTILPYGVQTILLGEVPIQ